MSERHLTRTAVFVILERDNKVFFLRRANTSWGNGYLNVPSGHVEKGERPTVAAVREVKEETGVDIKLEDLEFVHADRFADQYSDYTFRVRRWEGEPTINEPEFASEALWIDKDHLPDDITPHMKNLFEQLKRGSFYSELEDELM
jgi:8-oxo-dGTP diphosphatase